MNCSVFLPRNHRKICTGGFICCGRNTVLLSAHEQNKNTISEKGKTMTIINDTVEQLEIRNLLSRMAHRADNGTLEDYKHFYASDAVWEIVGKHKLTGHQEIVEAARKRWEEKFTGPDSNTRHVISTIDVSVKGKMASSRSVIQFFTHTNETPVLMGIATYEDVFEKLDGRWQVKSRRILAPDV